MGDKSGMKEEKNFPQKDQIVLNKRQKKFFLSIRLVTETRIYSLFLQRPSCYHFSHLLFSYHNTFIVRTFIDVFFSFSFFPLLQPTTRSSFPKNRYTTVIGGKTGVF